MKKLFSVFLICLILFSNISFGYNDTYLPSNQINNALNNNVGYVSNMATLFDVACNYFSNTTIHNQNVGTSGYNFAIAPGWSGSTERIRFNYIGVFNNDEIVFTGQNTSPYAPAFTVLHNGSQITQSSYSYIWGTIIINLDGTIYSPGSISSTSTTQSYMPNARLLCEKSNSNYYNHICSTSSNLNDLKSFYISSTGRIRQINPSNTPSVTDCLTNLRTGFGPQITSQDYYNISVSRNNLEQVSNGSHNYYANTNIDFSFTNYFSENVLSDAELWYTLIIDNLNYSFIPVTKAVNGYTNNRITLDLSSANADMLSNINGGLTLVLWYQLPNSFGTRFGMTSYKFYVNAYDTSTGLLPSGTDNTTSVSGYDNNIPININNVIQYDDNLNNAGVDNSSSNTDFGGLTDGDMRSRFSAMFDFFAIAFSWLPSEIIIMVKAGFAIAVVFIIYKIIRG